MTGLWKGWLPNCQRAAMVSIGGIYGSHDAVVLLAVMCINVQCRDE